jgi:hypothetical protein
MMHTRANFARLINLEAVSEQVREGHDLKSRHPGQ